MRNTITLTNLGDGTPATGKAVEAYQWISTYPYYALLVGTFTEVIGTGEYYIDVSAPVRVTILVNSAVLEAFTGVLLQGDIGSVSIPDGSITTAKLADDVVTEAKVADSAITPQKTTFAYDW